MCYACILYNNTPENSMAAAQDVQKGLFCIILSEGYLHKRAFM